MSAYDYIITGSGASGLMLAYRMAKDPFFSNIKILLLDKEKKRTKDHVWCYWEQNQGIWDSIVSKKWDHILFASPDHTERTAIKPYTYKMVHSQQFYAHIWNIIDKKKNFTFVHDELLNIEDLGESVIIKTKKTSYSSKKVINSVMLDEHYRDEEHYPVLNQHFVGWFVKTKAPAFDVDMATFMDFTIPQKGNTRFMYMLPTSATEALLEYTLFSKSLLPEKEYEDAIESYLNKKGLVDYEIVAKERGSIPMTSYVFNKHNSKNVLHIGTAGGWTKASTGYTFNNATKKTEALIAFLKTNPNLSQFSKKNKYWYYDLLLLDVLSQHNEKGASLFASMFRRGNAKTIFKFLDEETTILEDLNIIASMPQLTFLKALFSRIRRSFL